MGELRQAKTPEELVQDAFIVYAQGVDAANKYGRYSPCDGYATERWIHKANMEAHFTCSRVIMARAVAIDPNII